MKLYDDTCNQNNYSVNESWLIRVLSDHLNSRVTEPFITDWGELYALSEMHEVTGIVYYQCKSFVPSGYGFEKRYATEAFHFQNRLNYFKQVEAAFYMDNIPFFVVKGLAISKLYPIPWLRTMGDCDLVVHTVDKEKAHKVMLKLGFECKLQAEDEWVYFKNGIEFELHNRLLYDDNVVLNLSWAKFLNKMWDYINADDRIASLDWNFHYIYLLIHLQKHLFGKGVGIRQFMDLYVIRRTCNLDWKWINNVLDELDLRMFSDRCSELIDSWFGDSDFKDEFVFYATKKVLENGVFGIHTKDNSKNRVSRIILRDNKNSLTGSGKRIFRLVFPRYDIIRNKTEFSFVDGHSWLMPVAWLYRMYRILRYRNTDYVFSAINQNMISKNNLENYKRELSQWGLK